MSEKFKDQIAAIPDAFNADVMIAAAKSLDLERQNMTRRSFQVLTGAGVTLGAKIALGEPAGGNVPDIDPGLLNQLNTRVKAYIISHQEELGYDPIPLLNTVSEYPQFYRFLESYKDTLYKNMADTMIGDPFAVLVADYYRWTLNSANNVANLTGDDQLTFANKELFMILNINQPEMGEGNFDSFEDFGSFSTNSVVVGEKLIIWGTADDAIESPNDGQIVNGKVEQDPKYNNNRIAATKHYMRNRKFLATMWRHTNNKNSNADALVAAGN